MVFMGNFKLHDLYAFIRSNIRVAIAIFLFVYALFTYLELKQYSRNHKDILGSVRILRQMQEYSKIHCQNIPNQPSSKVDNNLTVLKQNKRKNVTKDTVASEVTFILLGPTIRCLGDKMSWLRSRYKTAKIFIALDFGIPSVYKQEKVSTLEGHFLGGFTNIPEALNHAILLVNTKYFMIIDHKMDLGNMQENFIEIFLANIPGYDILSGSLVDTHGEFTIPCRRLRLRYWSYHHSYQYNTSGDILDCDATSLYFLGHNKVFKNMFAPNTHLFDKNLSLKWIDDFFIRFRQVLKVGVLPEVIIRQKVPKDCFVLDLPVMSALKQTELLLPFAKKHQLFYINNETSRIDVCKNAGTSANCSERGIQREWGVRHWADAGLTTYPFIIESLQKALHFGTKQLEELHLMYVVEGGTLLGLVKLRDILPWDHGDIDTFVYATRRKVINMVKDSFHKYGYEFWLRHTGFHTYVTDDSASLNGCIVYLTRRVKPKAIAYMRHAGKLFPVRRDLFKFLRQFYGSVFLENHMKISNQRSYCITPGHHACMPDCRWDGCGGGL